MIYKLETFGQSQGYTITWKELSAIIDKIFPDENLDNGWYRKWEANDWIKADINRTCLNLKYYRNFKLREQKAMGFYDNVNCRYIITDKYRKVIDIIAKYQEGGELAEEMLG